MKSFFPHPSLTRPSGIFTMEAVNGSAAPFALDSAFSAFKQRSSHRYRHLIRSIGLQQEEGGRGGISQMAEPENT